MAKKNFTMESLGLKPSSEESWNSGGTAHYLPNERKKASFEQEKMTNFLDGGPDATRRRRFVLSPGERRALGDDKYHMDRPELMERSIKDFIGIHKKFVEKGYNPKADEFPWMVEGAMNTGSLMPHYGLFLPTILGQGSMEQTIIWAPRALNFQIVGSYAQTELGHGSNVRGLQTVAHYDKRTQEFVLNTPTLQSMKWWNSNIGCAATHAVVYANLILEGKEHGVHVFMVQVRDENHNMLPGIEAGDVGPKLGDHAIDTGYLRLKDVRIPREHMLCKRQSVTPEGKYVKHGKEEGEAEGSGGKAEKMHYATMMQARAGMISASSGKLAIACTIAVRYSAVRHQGFVNTAQGASFRSAERPIIDYQVQLYRLMKQVATAYCFKVAGQWMTLRFEQVMSAAMGSSGSSDGLDDLPEIHATAAGLKGLITKTTADGMEDLRKCLGGHGYLLTSGIAALLADYSWQVTAEGDWVVMLLQTARYLMKSLETARKGGKLAGLTENLAPLRDPKFDPLRDAIPPPCTTVEEAMDLNRLLALFRWRALVSVVRAGDNLRAQQAKGLSFDEAWNGCALSMQRAAICHCYYFLLSKFVILVHQHQDPAIKTVLSRLCALFACSNILDGIDWAALLDGKQTGLFDAATGELLKQLRPDAVPLVDAFDIPDRILNSALGSADGNVYERLFVSAKKSQLNHIVPFQGYTEHLRPHLDLKFLALRNRTMPEDFDEMTPEQIAKLPTTAELRSKL